jgi:hypothetical protein
VLVRASPRCSVVVVCAVVDFSLGWCGACWDRFEV